MAKGTPWFSPIAALADVGDLLPAASEPWVIPAFRTCPVFPEQQDWLSARIAPPSAEVRQELEHRGFSFLAEGAARPRAATLDLAAVLIDLLPSLGDVVRAHVRWVSLLAADEAYDVSHSEPRWPDWIFVSCPAAADQVSALRVAENVVHEAMHLQLTLVEAELPLIRDEQMMLHSPWKDELRDLRGVLHGLYVFRCVSEFLASPKLAASLTSEGETYVRRRIEEIEEEVRAVDIPSLLRGQTAAGRAFTRLI